MDPASQSASESAGREERVHAAQRVVLRNAMFLIGAQVLTMPLSVVVNAIMARSLGPEDYGYIYLASTFIGFGFLAVEWGQAGTLPAMVARDRSSSGKLLGSGLLWRLATSVLMCVLLAGLCVALGYGRAFMLVLALMLPTAIVATVISACSDVVRGFERTDVTAYTQVGAQLLGVSLVIPTLLLGGDLYAVLIAQFVAGAIPLPFVWRALKPVGVNSLSFQSDTLKRLVVDGFSFMSFSIAIALHANVDAVFLSKLAPPETVGWHAAARKLIGLLLFPAVALINSLYPTLCRLHVEDKEAFRRTGRGALQATSALVAPVALGCALYPDIGIRIFSRETFGPAEDNLRVMALFLALAYFSMPLGSCLLAAGKQRAWAIIQFLSVGLSLILDPLIIPWFQEHHGNGGLGVCWATVACEVLMVGAGIALAPRGIFDLQLLRALSKPMLGALAMAGTAWLLRAVTPFAAAPLAVCAYAGTLWLTGGIEPAHVAAVRALLKRKFRRG